MRRGWFRHYLRARLHRRLFGLMTVAIVGSFLLSLAVFRWAGPGRKWDPRRIERFASTELAHVWEVPVERRRLLEGLHQAFDVAIALRDPDAKVIEQVGPSCPSAHYELEVKNESGSVLGQVAVCDADGSLPSKSPWLLSLLTFGVSLWLVSGVLAHRLGRPLGDLVRVTQAIGAGDLKSRARLGRHRAGEIGLLAESINFMAARIEKQIEEHKELLAAVSHEIRTPLARLRVLGELVEEGREVPELGPQISREIAEMDDLVGRLLAHSRLEFQTERLQELDARDLALTALERQGLPESLLEAQANLRAQGDPTLLGRALINLLQNARAHGRGVLRVNVRAEADRICFEVEDRGPGIAEEDRSRVFEAFFARHKGEASGGGSASLGLGLSLVRRIARAHGGEAWAAAAPSGGALVGFWIPRARSTTHESRAPRA